MKLFSRTNIRGFILYLLHRFPPNPAEMLTSDKLLKLIEILKEKYDVVILDTPPVAYVADMYQLRDLIDANTFIVVCQIHL